MQLEPLFETKKQFIPFITAGYPTIDENIEIIKLFVDLGIEIIEIGIPFSDPIADGPTIQYSSMIALKNNINIPKTFDIINKVNKFANPHFVIMTYLNPVIAYGTEKFIKEASQLGVKGIIFPELIPEEKNTFYQLTNKFKIDNIFLLSSVTSPQRRKLFYKFSQGFIYLITITGTTGKRESLPKYFYEFVKIVRKETKKPICAGFGISNVEQVKPILDYINGFVVGSAIIEKIKDYSGKERINKLKEFINQFRKII